ncbi:MAG TPA: 30S ribosomal protein S8 [Chloroflexota bacterium]|jgi:small subunit ribosomal protein S8|nr:30S ribosomal protein S8 [Chloroflexota bacterium]
MYMTDPIADMLTRIRNASVARHEYVDIPASKLKRNIAQILREQGFIKDFEILKDSKYPTLRVRLRYTGKREPVITGLKRVSKPGQRIYRKASAMPRVLGGMGVAIVSTPRGLMTERQARLGNVGGEVLCYVW